MTHDLPEYGASASHVVGGNHDLPARERGVGEVDVDVSVGELAGQLAEGCGPVLDVDHEDLAFVGDPHSGALKGRPADGRAGWHDGDPVSPAGPVLVRHATWRRTPACTISVKVPGMDLTLDGESPSQRSCSRWPAFTAASAGRLRQRGTGSPRPTARRALAAAVTPL